MYKYIICYDLSNLFCAYILILHYNLQPPSAFIVDGRKRFLILFQLSTFGRTQTGVGSDGSVWSLLNNTVPDPVICRLKRKTYYASPPSPPRHRRKQSADAQYNNMIRAQARCSCCTQCTRDVLYQRILIAPTKRTDSFSSKNIIPLSSTK